jgi:amino acid adenylation domain-containing protein
VVFGTVLFGRMQGGESIDKALGIFINTLPARVHVDARGVTDALREVHRHLADLLRHEHAPLALAQRCSGVDTQAPLFTALLNYRYTIDTDVDGGISALQGIDVLRSEERTNYPVDISINDAGEDLQLIVQTVAQIDPYRLCHYLRVAVEGLLTALTDAPQTSLRQIPVLPDAERAVIMDWRTRPRDYPVQQCVHTLFEQQVAARPEAVAVITGGEPLSYRRLNGRANQLAHYLISRGVRPDSRVALSAARGSDMLIALLAIFKAGGAYVPLDPNYPAERLIHMLNDSEPVVVLADAAGREALTGLEQAVPFVDLQADAAHWQALSAANPDPATLGLRPHHLAYVIYTSGSTGRPKGVMIEHAGVINYSLELIRLFELQTGDRVLQQNSLNFDLSLEEILPTLLSGATLLPADGLFGLGQQAGIGPTVVHLTAAHWHTLVGEWQQVPVLAQQHLAGVRLINVTGDAVSAQKLAQWQTLEVRPRLINTYGPTEATISCSATYLDDHSEAVRVSIGKPFANTPIYILDKHLEPVPVGVAGELYVGGIQVGRGYLNLPEQTAARFIADPFQQGGRLYKTGDLARWLPDGRIDFLGRDDSQVKVRGFRIELGEIENALAVCEGVQDVAVVAREDAHRGEKRLLAYVTGSVDIGTLRATLADQLPQHMLPSAYVLLPRLPLTPNGKLDRDRLPAPDGDAYVSQGYEAPRGEIEETLAALWAELLQVERVGRHDNFFELGGHSLLAVQAVLRMPAELGVEIELADFYRHATIAKLEPMIVEAQLDQFDAEALSQLMNDLDGITE